MSRPKRGKMLKACAFCGLLFDCVYPSLFAARKYCSPVCSGKGQPQKIKVERTLTHRRARFLVPHGPCRLCLSREGRDVHHMNDDEYDNRAENLLRLCRSCHMLSHHRNWKFEGIGGC